MAAPSQAMLRLMQDLKECKKDPPEGTSAGPVSDDDLMHWNATIVGPEGTAWESGLFSLKIVFTEDYPDKPPHTVKFNCEMYHPNVYPDGSLCLDIIGERWNPTFTMGTLLASIQSLLSDPNPDSPANPEAARVYEQDRKEDNKRVRRVAERSLGL